VSAPEGLSWIVLSLGQEERVRNPILTVQYTRWAPWLEGQIERRKKRQGWAWERDIAGEKGRKDEDRIGTTRQTTRCIPFIRI
jgi:hypothetical protein